MADETYKGVLLSSRYDEPGEITVMRKVVDQLLDIARPRIKSIWCNSKASADFHVTVRDGAWMHALDEHVLAAFRAALVGFNGVTVNSDNDTYHFGAEWPEDPDRDESD